MQSLLPLSAISGGNYPFSPYLAGDVDEQGIAWLSYQGRLWVSVRLANSTILASGTATPPYTVYDWAYVPDGGNYLCKSMAFSCLALDRSDTNFLFDLRDLTLLSTSKRNTDLFRCNIDRPQHLFSLPLSLRPPGSDLGSSEQWVSHFYRALCMWRDILSYCVIEFGRQNSGTSTDSHSYGLIAGTLWSVFADSTGFLYGSESTSGRIYRSSLDGRTATLLSITTSSGVRSDTAHCMLNSIDVAVSSSRTTTTMLPSSTSTSSTSAATSTSTSTSPSTSPSATFTTTTSAPAASTFPCDGNVYVLKYDSSGSLGRSGLYQISPPTGQTTFLNYLTLGGAGFNALGYNQVDNLLYAAAGTNLVAIDILGNVVVKMTLPSGNYGCETMDAAGVMYLSSHDGSWVQINLVSPTPSIVASGTSNLLTDSPLSTTGHTFQVIRIFSGR